jgi:hypothetical protein
MEPHMRAVARELEPGGEEAAEGGDDCSETSEALERARGGEPSGEADGRGETDDRSIVVTREAKAGKRKVTASDGDPPIRDENGRWRESATAALPGAVVDAERAAVAISPGVSAAGLPRAAVDAERAAVAISSGVSAAPREGGMSKVSTTSGDSTICQEKLCSSEPERPMLPRGALDAHSAALRIRSEAPAAVAEARISKVGPSDDDPPICEHKRRLFEVTSSADPERAAVRVPPPVRPIGSEAARSGEGRMADERGKWGEVGRRKDDGRFGEVRADGERHRRGKHGRVGGSRDGEEIPRAFPRRDPDVPRRGRQIRTVVGRQRKTTFTGREIPREHAVAHLEV